jgi:hypothetical protein
MDSRPLSPSSKVVIVGLAPRLRRCCYRHQIQRLAYLNLDQANGGIIRNLGEAGIAIQAVAPLCPNQEVFLRFDLAQPRVRVQATGRVAWADPAGQAGVEFLSLPQRSRRLLKEWIFIQLLTMALQATGATCVESGEQAAELLFSASSRPAIRLEPEVREAWLAEENKQPRAFDLSWFPFAISAPALSRLVDGLILLSSVLLFAVICMVMIGAVPAWPVTLILGLGITAVFAALYWFLFWFWIGGTPGSFLARITVATFDEGDIQADDRPRFR